jgi:NitT/TauT family transport system ATP-binding protein
MAPIARPQAKVVVDQVSRTYGAVRALEGIDLVFDNGSFVSIVGPSGCGKSTLLRLISGLELPSSGSILVDGQKVEEPPAKLGFMFQRDALLPWATVEENIGVGMELAGLPEQRHADRKRELIGFLGLAGFEKHYPAQLSGGMRQRVSLGRLLAYEPELYLMDEPFGALDAQTKILMARELLRIWSTYTKSVIFVTHDIEEAVFLSDRVIVMSPRPGRVQADFKIDLPRPRDFRTTKKIPLFQELCAEIWDQILATGTQD